MGGVDKVRNFLGDLFGFGRSHPGPTLAFNILVEPGEEKNTWLAICLELDIIVQGKTPNEAENNLRDAIQMYLESVFEKGDFESLWRPAPTEYWQKLMHTKPRLSLNLVNA